MARSTIEESRPASASEAVGDVEAFGVPTIILPSGRGMFGPVVAQAPTGEEAGELWDHVRWLIDRDGFFELKRERDRRAGAEAVHHAVREPQLDRSALDPLERMEDDPLGCAGACAPRHRDCAQCLAQVSRSGAGQAGTSALGSPLSSLRRWTDPSPGTNGGLWKNGTRFSQSFTA